LSFVFSPAASKQSTVAPSRRVPVPMPWERQGDGQLWHYNVARGQMMRVCKGHGLNPLACYHSQKKRRMPCSICMNLFHPGSVYVPEYTDYDTPVVDHEHSSGQPVPEEKHYVCADCFRYTRPKNSQCNCAESLQYYKQHERERLAEGPGKAWIREKNLSNLRSIGVGFFGYNHRPSAQLH